MVGRANGRSTKALMAPRPGKESRTSTHAMSSPATALITATTMESPTVRISAFRAVLLVTTSRNGASVALTATAASGMSTIRLSQTVATPRPSVPASSGERRALRSGSARALLRSGDSRVLLDLGYGARGRIEELVVDLRPPAEGVDGEELLRRRELRGELLRDRRVDRAVAVARERLLARLGPQVVDERLRLRLRRLRGRHGVLDQDRLVRDDVVDVGVLLLGGDRLVLVGDRDVSVAVEERLERLAAALVLHGDVLREQLAQVVEGLGLRLAELELGAVGGHQVPLGAARGERVRRQHLHARLEQVGPGVDALRVALADHEGDHGIGHEALVAVVGPAAGHEAGVDEAVHVRREGEGDHVGLLAGLDGAALVPRGAVGLREADALAGAGLRERRDGLVVDDLRGGVGDERELRRRAARAARVRGAVGRAAAG